MIWKMEILTLNNYFGDVGDPIYGIVDTEWVF